MRTIALTALCMTLACDLNEGPGEEAEEAVNAVQDGKSLDQIGDQVEDVGQAVTQPRSKLERRLADIDAWLDERHQELKATGEQASDDVQNALDDLGRRAEALRTKLADQTAALGDDIERELAEIEAKIDEMTKEEK